MMKKKLYCCYCCFFARNKTMNEMMLCGFSMNFSQLNRFNLWKLTTGFVGKFIRFYFCWKNQKEFKTK